MNLKIRVDKRKINFLAGFKAIALNKKIMASAYKRKKEVKKIWEKNKGKCEIVLSEIFDNDCVDLKLKIIIVPDILNIGAVETNKKEIIYGHKKRSKYYDLAIIFHEITHVFLSEIDKNGSCIVHEAICFMMEDLFYKSFDKLSITQIWELKELDDFHKKALKLSQKIKKNKKMKIKDYLEYLYKNINKNVQDIKPPQGLLLNI